MFEKLLIANRGEIACRIARTARRLGVKTVAVYSDADAGALHVSLADEAWPIGPAPAQDSYLAMDKILDVAKRSGAQALHPGYGFLAENAEFAERCGAAGLVFVGPPPQAMRLMGSKASAKTLMERAGVPIVPGYHAEDADIPTLKQAAMRMGFPALIKASAGGGGRGMRIVHTAAEFDAAAEGATREALAAFGDGRLLIEKYLARPRHIEIQIFADAFGHFVSFFERDCSMQRHHQKILEETPAPGLSPSLRRPMREAAIEAARAAGYVGAGTVEFLVQGDAFYFLEMNTRLQVEHPITEMIAGQDLVEWQLRIACGEQLPLTQNDLVMRGCAIEARVCAEDPARDFLPSVGVIEHYRPPVEIGPVRVDAGVRRGDRVTHYYDSLIAKLVVWGADRAAALRNLHRALDDFELVGVTTNLDFLRALARHPRFALGAYDVGFVEREAQALNAAATATDDDALLLAAGAAVWLADLQPEERDYAAANADPFSPWMTADGWRLYGVGSCELHFSRKDRALSARLHLLSRGAFKLETNTGEFIVHATLSDGRMRLRIDGVEREVGIVRRANGLVVIAAGRNLFLDYVDALRPASP
ncbi:MAG: ATP-grasp domain-containing protein, partial [Methylocystis sp.]|nr:ATP-grasp domain-containing protein [Methylocystis sp.]